MSLIRYTMLYYTIYVFIYILIWYMYYICVRIYVYTYLSVCICIDWSICIYLLIYHIYVCIRPCFKPLTLSLPYNSVKLVQMRKLRHREITLPKVTRCPSGRAVIGTYTIQCAFHDTMLPASRPAMLVSFGFDFWVQTALKSWLSSLQPVMPALPSSARTSLPAITAALLQSVS